jgi:hypothetical protein
MAGTLRSTAAGLVGAAAGLGAVLPRFTCPGGACSSCFACAGVATAAVSLLLARAAFAARHRAQGKEGTNRRCRAGGVAAQARAARSGNLFRKR